MIYSDAPNVYRTEQMGKWIAKSTVSMCIQTIKIWLTLYIRIYGRFRIYWSQAMYVVQKKEYFSDPCDEKTI